MSWQDNEMESFQPRQPESDFTEKRYRLRSVE